MDIPILYEDTDILVIDKPAGITVNKSDTTQKEQTVQDWAEEYLKIHPRSSGEKLQEVEEESTPMTTYDPSAAFYERAGIVHRLDKETSGILLVARTPESFINLQKQFKDRTVKKIYCALAHGKVVPTEGVVNVPVGRLPWNRKQFGVVAGGRQAVTRYRVISNFQFPISNFQEKFSLVELYPETGRTHQIRVHMQYLHHPLFGDFLYAGRKTSRNDRKLLERVFLHAAKISFMHPKTQQLVLYESPLPEKLQSVLRNMQKEVA